MAKYYACRVGELTENSHFNKTFHMPIIKEEYNNIRWAINEASISKKMIDSINKDIKNRIDVYTVLFPNKPFDYAYAICKLKMIKERILGPLIALDETNKEREWINSTRYGNGDFKYDFIYSEIYLLNKKSFNSIKLKGQSTFFRLRDGIKNEDLYKQIKKEIGYIKIYIKPIKYSF